MRFYIHFVYILVLFTGPLGFAKSSLREVNLEWGEVEGATAYDLELSPTGPDQADRKSLKKRLKGAQWSGEIGTGAYQMRIRSIDDRGVPGEWSEPTPIDILLPAIQVIAPKFKTSISSSESKEESVEFKWKKVEGADSYQIEVISEDERTKISKIVKNHEATLDLPVAQAYQWKVTAIDSEKKSGDPMLQPSLFVVVGKNLDLPRVEEPENKYVQKLKWAPTTYAENYSFLLLRLSKSGKWQLVEKGEKSSRTEIAFKSKYQGGRYKLMVRSHGKLRRASDYTQMEFDVHDGDRSPAAVQQSILRESIDKPSAWYAIASYLVTQVDYVSTIPEENSRAVFSTLGGVGRLGIGFNPPSSLFGGFAILDLGGFTFEQKNFTYSSSELHATYNIPLKVSVAQVSSGLFQKDLPVVYRKTGSSNYAVESLTNNGLHLGAKFWHPFTSRIGASLHTQIYFNIGGRSPDGGQVRPTTTLEYGLLGTYRLSQKMMGFAGYTFREDRASYSARNSSDAPADISLQGHYLNMILEYSF